MIKSINVTQQNYLDYSDFATKRLFKTKTKSKVKLSIKIIKNMILWLVIAVILMVIFQVKSISLVNFHWQSSLMTAAPFIIFIVIFFININECKRLSVPNENGLMIGDKTIELGPKGINELNSFGHSFYKWEIIEGIEENKGDIYIFVDKLLALIIPFNSFSTIAEKDEFKALIQKYIACH